MNPVFSWSLPAGPMHPKAGHAEEKEGHDVTIDPEAADPAC